MKTTLALAVLAFFSFPVLAQSPAPRQPPALPPGFILEVPQEPPKTQPLKLSKCLETGSFSEGQLAFLILRMTYRVLLLDMVQQARPEFRPEIWKMVSPYLQRLLDDDERLGFAPLVYTPDQAPDPKADLLVDCAKLLTIRPMHPKEEAQAWRAIAEMLSQERKDAAVIENRLWTMLKESHEENAQLRNRLLGELLREENRGEFAEAARRLDEMRDRWLRDDLHVFVQRANQILLQDLLRPPR